ncbi:16314_t:CDS:2 [Funneliformis caledonium]|uniref:16314_t:CDS:1 n=1 Tax=Funneliformis caledonium TaxID=1117310 RepID=A0A9N9F2W7_9GLOM|nr:16314_t:CDS:2 [Funneliformis caledonium]
MKILKRILPSVNYIQQEISSDQIDIELDAELEDIKDLLDILPESVIPFLVLNEEIISDSEPELELIGIKEAA